MKITSLLKNIIHKIDQNVNVELITDPEIDTLFGTAAGTSTDAQDYIVEHAVSQTASDGTQWTYFKYASGVVDMWGYKKVQNVTSYTTFSFGNNINAYGRYVDMYYPFTLTGKPLVIPAHDVGEMFTISTVVDSQVFTDRVRAYALEFHIGTAGAQTFTARCHLVGLWK